MACAAPVRWLKPCSDRCPRAGLAMVRHSDADLQLQTQPSFGLVETYGLETYGLGADDPALPSTSLNHSLSGIDSKVQSADLRATVSQATAFPKHWSYSRVCIASLLSSMYFDMVIGVAVLVNIGLIVSGPGRNRNFLSNLNLSFFERTGFRVN